MRIDSIRLHHIEIPFKATFKHALHQRQKTEAVIVAIRCPERLAGFGEILPRPYLTGETIRGVLETEAPRRVRRWLGRSFSRKQEVFDFLKSELEGAGRGLATFAGFELALLDLAGQKFGFPAGELVGHPPGRELEPGVVIDFNIPTEELREYGLRLRLTGKRHVKVKVGRSDDLRRLEIISATLGSETSLRLDANGAWSAQEAIESLASMSRFKIQSIEQPVPASDLEGMRQVRQSVGLPVMADESLCTLEDGQRLIDSEAADIFNIRLGKCGGFSGALRLVQLARENNLGCHLGSLVGETGILSYAAEDFGKRVEEFECLEGKGQNKVLLEADIVEPAHRNPDSNESNAGLGIQVLEDRLKRFSISESVIFKDEGIRA